MTELLCSFCGKQEKRVRRLIAGPGVYICNECVELCQEVLDEGRGAEPHVARPDDVGPAAERDERGTEILERDDLPQALEQLSYRERRVLELRYGLSGEQPRTLDEVGTTFKLTREEIRQIESQSLTKLQASAGRPPD